MFRYLFTDIKKERRIEKDEEMKEKLRDHEENCFAFVAQRTEFPDNLIVKVKNIQNQVETPFSVYADFESILKQLSDGNKYQGNIACSYAYQIASNVPGVKFDSRIYVGDAVDHLLDTLQEDLNKYIMPLIEKDVDMVWDGEARARFLLATHFHHCYFTGQFRGASRQHCNFNYKIDKSKYKLPVVFHNHRVTMPT